MPPKQCRILNIDSEVKIHKLIEVTLDNVAWVDGCNKFVHAEKIFLERFPTHKYNMIIMELFERRASDGLNFIKKLRENGIDIPIIIVSLCIQEIFKKKAKELGVCAYFTKPFNPNKLEQSVGTHFFNYLKSKGIKPKKRVIRDRS